MTLHWSSVTLLIIDANLSCFNPFRHSCAASHVHDYEVNPAILTRSGSPTYCLLNKGILLLSTYFQREATTT